MSEALDPLRVQKFLGWENPPEIRQFRAGWSNLTYLLRDGDRAAVLRRPPHGTTVKSAHDMLREFRILEALHPVYPRVPKPIAACEDTSVIGAPFYVMEFVDGLILRDRIPPEITADGMQALSEAFVDNLVDIHAVNPSAFPFGHGDGYVMRQIDGWTKRWEHARTDDVAPVERTATWLAENMPKDAGQCLIHNDYKYDNLVLDPTRISDIRAVLDWEMATVGDPLMDLGTSLGYWIDAADPPEMRALPFAITAAPGNFTRRGIVARYETRSGRAVSNPVFYYAYGLFKIAVVAQQIYARWRQGHTKDERFATLDQAVLLLGQAAERAIARGTV